MYVYVFIQCTQASLIAAQQIQYLLHFTQFRIDVALSRHSFTNKIVDMKRVKQNAKPVFLTSALQISCTAQHYAS